MIHAVAYGNLIAEYGAPGSFPGGPEQVYKTAPLLCYNIVVPIQDLRDGLVTH